MFFIFGISISCLLYVFITNFKNRQLLAEVQSEATQILDDKENQLSQTKWRNKKEIQKKLHALKRKTSSQAKLLQEKLRTLNYALKDFRTENQGLLPAVKKRIDELSSRVKQLQSNRDKRKHSFKVAGENYDNIKEQLFSQLKQKTQLDEVKEKKILQENLTKKMNKVLNQRFEAYNLHLKDTVPQKAQEILHLTLQRLTHSTSTERGLSPINFENSKNLDLLFSNNKELLNIIKEECGVDILIKEQEKLAYVLGLDPVRTQWAYNSLSQVFRAKRIHYDAIQKILKENREQLLKTISKNGNQIAKSLQIKGLHEKILITMGCLKYRFSFTQNQYHHCEEVGFLCGMLMSELGLSTYDGRRAGVLHDIGKAMDHSQDGSHALIGASYIEEHGETEKIVHAVRSHHFDTQPAESLDWLVIAADAISGARVGARKSTIDTYSEKISKIEQICTGFAGVKSAFVLNGGREVHVHVDEKSLSDKDSLSLSKNVAKKIEEECTYPGHIKVSIFRENQISYIAK